MSVVDGSAVAGADRLWRGMSYRAAATRFGVAAAMVIRWNQLATQHGHIRSQAAGRETRSRRIKAHRETVLALVNIA